MSKRGHNEGSIYNREDDSFPHETEDFAITVACERMTTWPRLYVELRSFFLHTHEKGPKRAVEPSLARIRTHLLADQDTKMVEKPGIFAAHGVLSLEDKPLYTVGDLLTQHLDLLVAVADDNGGGGQVLQRHFAKVYKVPAPRDFVPASHGGCTSEIVRSIHPSTRERRLHHA
jgi:hypothetical protein